MDWAIATMPMTDAGARPFFAENRDGFVFAQASFSVDGWGAVSDEASRAFETRLCKKLQETATLSVAVRFAFEKCRAEFPSRHPEWVSCEFALVKLHKGELSLARVGDYQIKCIGAHTSIHLDRQRVQSTKSTASYVVSAYSDFNRDVPRVSLLLADDELHVHAVSHSRPVSKTPDLASARIEDSNSLFHVVIQASQKTNHDTGTF